MRLPTQLQLSNWLISLLGRAYGFPSSALTPTAPKPEDPLDKSEQPSTITVTPEEVRCGLGLGQVSASKFALERHPVKVKLQDGAQLPTRAHSDDAGYDLHYNGRSPMLVAPGGVADVPCGVSIQWPGACWCMIVGRSSSFRNKGLLVNVAIIDPGYRGELFAVVRNITDSWITIEQGERVAQAVPMTSIVFLDGMEVVDELDPSERGEKGFGSSG